MDFKSKIRMLLMVIIISLASLLLVASSLAAVPNIQQAKLTADDGAANDLFGRSVAISGDTALVGAILTTTILLAPARSMFSRAQVRPGPSRQN